MPIHLVSITTEFRIYLLGNAIEFLGAIRSDWLSCLLSKGDNDGFLLTKKLTMAAATYRLDIG